MVKGFYTMSKKRKPSSLVSKAERLAIDLAKWRERQETAIKAIIKSSAQIAKLAATIRRAEAKQAKAKAEALAARAAAKEARKALQAPPVVN